MEWDPVKYVQFGDYRDRPFFDLTQRIHADSPRLVVDLGCGPGNLTATLAERWPGAEVVGIDSSAAMLEQAAVHTERFPNLHFELGDIAAWTPGRADVVVSNAALQWVPGHEFLLPGWLNAMPEGSWLAFQVPGNFGAPSHVLMRELAETPQWSGKLDGVLRRRDAVGEPADYLRIALDAGWRADAWETSYQQLLPGQDPVLEWVRGTGLRPVLGALDAADALLFEKEYAARLRDAYPSTAHGTVFPFRRIFTVAHKPAGTGAGE
ncbi:MULTISPECIES: trans-aconitate 2-methyltransferase [Arthrobacter]|uniref:Trans-aconitate 2-methyltransferase n=2 Tax=Arthrobacter TaxID=1663 RepID=A0ABU9KGW0_9MICC|nr:trans-aconitate 2-methyltransferase [Arthrobacter sp. YJM1]MDP5226116.1 trans-aconitate 2-methyltransferase [Arthrobacter sp. YJM1]